MSVNISEEMSNVDTLTENKIIIIKNDGRHLLFDYEKITYHLRKVVDQPTAIAITKELLARLDKSKNSVITALKIHQLVIDLLKEADLEAALESWQNFYLAKKEKRTKELDIQTNLEKLMHKDQAIVNENANKASEIFNTQRDLTASAVAKNLGLKMLPPHVVNAHLRGDIHFHDLDYSPYAPMTNCCLIDFKSMLAEGFKIGNADVESPKSIQTATAQMAQIIANVASSQYGGCSADRIDEFLAPYAELNYQKHMAEAREWIEDTQKQQQFADTKTKKDIYDAMQSLEYEINTLYSSQGQTPFTSIGFGLGTSWFEKEIQKAILQVRIEGIGKEKRTAIFPKLIYVLKKDLNLVPQDPNYDVKELALACATQRMYPDILMYDKLVEITGSFKTPMGCRSFLQGWQDETGQEVAAGRMNLGVVTLNLPRIALESQGNQTKFWQILSERLAIVKDALVFRYQRCCEALPENAPILYQHGAFGERLKANESVKKLFDHRRATLSVGYIGLYEVGTVFFGANWEKDSIAKEFTIDIVKSLYEHAQTWSEEYDVHFSVYATPSESLTDRFCRVDTEKFGIIENITDKEYYTNSFHYDVRKKPTPFEKIDFEKDYPQYSSGGFIHYCEYPVLKQNPKALEAVWNFAYDKIAYLGTNTPIDHCFACGFDGDFNPTERGFECPECGNTDPKTCDVVKRTCGYLGNPQARPMVHGRHKEITSRAKNMPVFKVKGAEQK